MHKAKFHRARERGNTCVNTAKYLISNSGPAYVEGQMNRIPIRCAQLLKTWCLILFSGKYAYKIQANLQGPLLRTLYVLVIL